MANAILEAALNYKKLGFKVFPTKIDKTPYTAHGLKDATSMDFIIKEYWEKWPDAGIGLVTDGFVVIDFDSKSGGKASKTAIELKYGKMPVTRTHRTGGGGLHYIYSNPNGREIRNTVKVGGYAGVDIRAKGGYIVAPPSPHLSGKPYRVLDESPIAECPEWLVALSSSVKSWGGRGGGVTGKGDRGVGEGGLKFFEGERNAKLASLAGSMRRRGMPQGAIEAALLEVNRSQCSPPLTDNEVLVIAKSIARYSPDPLDSITDKTDILDITADKTDKTGIKTDMADTTDMTDKTDNMGLATDKRNDKAIWPLVDRWLTFHQGERFDLETICRQLNVTDRDHRHSVVKKLSYEITHKRLEKSVNVRPPLYRIIDNTITYINWLDSKPSSNLYLRWPGGIDGSQFDFNDRLDIPEKALIVLAGVTNTGKSVWCRNFLCLNMDAYHCTYFSSETSGEDFADYISRMPEITPVDKEGSPKFDLVDRNKDFKDVIDPAGINIIDWLNLGDNFYQIGTVLEGIKEKLSSGIAVIAIQKDPNKELGMGGMWGEHLASLYIAMDFGRLTVKKAKKWREWNPNNQTWGFDVVDRGAHLTNIRLLKRCGHCWNGKVKGANCQICAGTGFVDADTV